MKPLLPSSLIFTDTESVLFCVCIPNHNEKTACEGKIRQPTVSKLVCNTTLLSAFRRTARQLGKICSPHSTGHKHKRH